jgi:hypothetical protein
MRSHLSHVLEGKQRGKERKGKENMKGKNRVRGALKL